jgi:hypothetical protein
MAETIGLGNITTIEDILEYMPYHKDSPWEIYDAMQEAAIWISFA